MTGKKKTAHSRRTPLLKCPPPPPLPHTGGAPSPSCRAASAGSAATRRRPRHPRRSSSRTPGSPRGRRRTRAGPRVPPPAPTRMSPRARAPLSERTGEGEHTGTTGQDRQSRDNSTMHRWVRCLRPRLLFEPTFMLFLTPWFGNRGHLTKRHP